MLTLTFNIVFLLVLDKKVHLHFFQNINIATYCGNHMFLSGHTHDMSVPLVFIVFMPVYWVYAGRQKKFAWFKIGSFA